MAGVPATGARDNIVQARQRNSNTTVAQTHHTTMAQSRKAQDPRGKGVAPVPAIILCGSLSGMMLGVLLVMLVHCLVLSDNGTITGVVNASSGLGLARCSGPWTCYCTYAGSICAHVRCSKNDSTSRRLASSRAPWVAGWSWAPAWSWPSARSRSWRRLRPWCCCVALTGATMAMVDASLCVVYACCSR